MVSAYRINGQTQIKYQDLVKCVILETPRTPTRARPTSLLGALNLPCRSAIKIHLEGCRDKGPFSPQSVNHSRVLLRADPTLIITCVKYIVYKYMPVFTAQVITAR